MLFRCLHFAATDLIEQASRLPVVPRVLSLGLRRDVRRYPIIFVHVPKNAGTSISRLVYGASGRHYTADFYRRVFGDEFYRKPSFAVLRDVCDRFLSSYFFVRSGGTRDVPLHPYWREATIGIDSIDKYLAFLEARREILNRLDSAMRTQSFYVTDVEGSVLVRHLFVLGYHDEALSSFLEEHGYGPTIPRLNRSSRGNARLTSAQEQRVRELYACDVSLVERTIGNRGVGGRRACNV